MSTIQSITRILCVLLVAVFMLETYPRAGADSQCASRTKPR